MKILIIEDQADIRATLRDLLEFSGYEVLEAEDGVQGLKLAGQNPDFIICDVHMPNLDGRGVLQAIRSMPSVCDVPFVFLTAQAERDQHREGMALGADDYITKPFTTADILNAIQARLGRHENMRSRIKELQAQHEHAINAQWSHELLTPLNAIMGSLDLLEMEADTIDRDELKEMLGIIRHGAVRQERLSRKLIAYFRLEQMRLSPLATPPRCSDASAAVCNGAMRTAQQHGRGADLHADVQSAAVSIHEGDLKQMVGEVVENAAVFSGPGTEISVLGGIQDGVYRIEIIDRGPGMTAEQCSQIGAFVQFDRSSREQQGLGLGLMIAQSAAQRVGGQMSLQPGLGGNGLKVTLDIPLIASKE